MESNNPKEFQAHSIINRMRNWRSETNDPADNIEGSKWLNHFMTPFRNEVGSSKPENDSPSFSEEEDNHPYFFI